jgi:hypothetical protein
MTALKSDFSKLDRDGNGKITKDELKQDQTDQKLSGQDRAAATWLSNHYDDVANINYGWPWTTRIAKKIQMPWSHCTDRLRLTLAGARNSSKCYPSSFRTSHSFRWSILMRQRLISKIQTHCKPLTGQRIT